jgi:Ca2+/Na+ antiporter
MNFSYRDFKFDSGRIEVKNSFDPLIKLGMTSLVIITFLFLVAGIILKELSLVYFAMSLVALFFIFACGMYLFFAVKDPNRLQSEKHILDMKKLELTQHQKNEKDITPESLQELSENIQIESISVPYEESNDKGDTK